MVPHAAVCLTVRFAGNNHLLSALEGADSKSLTGLQLPLSRTGARRGVFTYRWRLAAARRAVRRQYLVQYMIPLTRAVCPGVPLGNGQVFHNHRIPCTSKAHGVLSKFDLPTMQCVTLEIRKPIRDINSRYKSRYTFFKILHYS